MMRKYSFLIVFFVVILSGIFSNVFPEETFTITTYYPSPYGSYNELQTNKLAVGDTSRNDVLDAADQPNNTGNIRLRPQDGDPSGWGGAEGELSYSRANRKFYYHDGAGWKPITANFSLVGAEYKEQFLTYTFPVGSPQAASVTCSAGKNIVLAGSCSHPVQNDAFGNPDFNTALLWCYRSLVSTMRTEGGCIVGTSCSITPPNNSSYGYGVVIYCK